MCWRTLLILATTPSMLVAGEEAQLPVPANVDVSVSARAMWTQNRPTNYRYVLRRDCYCVSPNHVEIDVRDGVVTNVIDLSSGESLDAGMRAEYATIDRLLAEIDDAIERKPDRMLIEYDRHTGYPARVDIDFSYRIADEELRYAIEKFDRL